MHRYYWISSRGRFVERFGQAFAREAGAAHAVSCSSGTAALHLALAALGIGPPPPPPADPTTVGSKTPPGQATKTRLFRIGNGSNSFWYVDEETFDPVPNAVAVVGWVLRVFTKPDPAFPGSSAVLLRYHFGCDSPSGSGGVLTKVEIDQTGKTRKTTASNAEEAALLLFTAGSIAEKLARTACYIDYPNIAPQLTVAAAIKDAAMPQ